MNEEIEGWQNGKSVNRYVAYIDIMGFKDMVARESPVAVYNMLETVIRVANDAKEVGLTPTPNLIKFTTYSDSIMIYSKDDSFESFYSIIFNLSTITNHLLANGIPHKGALAFGGMTLDFIKSIFFGQPLIDAYLLQEELLFYGIIIHGSAELKIESDDNRNKIGSAIKEYKCPLKNGTSYHLTIFPIYAGLNDPKFQLGTHKINESLKNFRFKTSGHLRKYIDNTIDYIKNAK